MRNKPLQARVIDTEAPAQPTAVEFAGPIIFMINPRLVA